MYNAMLPMINTFYVTHVDTAVPDADAFAPHLTQVDLAQEYDTIHTKEADQNNTHNFEIRKYTRV